MKTRNLFDYVVSNFRMEKYPINYPICDKLYRHLEWSIEFEKPQGSLPSFNEHVWWLRPYGHDGPG